MGKQSAPKPPDAKQTAAAQTGSNISTASAQAYLNATNQITPYGSLTYNQTGTTKITDPGTGQEYEVPQFTATQELSDVGKALFDKQTAMQGNLADLGVEQSDRLGDLLSTPFSLDNDVVEGRLMELGRKRLDPLLDQRREQQEQRLADRGVMAGSEAYRDAMRTLNEGENDAYNQLLLTGRTQAVNEALTERNQPINEILGIASGTQVQQPGYVPTGQTGIANTDIAGLISNQYNQELNAYNQQMANRNQMLGGLFGVGANLLMLSDDRTKKDAVQVGETDGMGVYSYRYKSENDNAPRRLGLMASEVERRHPEAVTTGPDGLKRVNYSMALGAA